MKEIIIEGSLIGSREELHEVLKEALLLPDYYGKNLDALWDMLTTELQLPVRITWKDFDITEKNIGAYAVKTAGVIKRASAEVDGVISFTIE